VVSDAVAPAYLAPAPAAVMFAYLRPATLLALALLTVVVADAGAPALLALSFATVVGALALRGARHGLKCFGQLCPHSTPIHTSVVLTLGRADKSQPG
jgi:hypothetical protein